MVRYVWRPVPKDGEDKSGVPYRSPRIRDGSGGLVPLRVYDLGKNSGRPEDRAKEVA